MSCSNSNKKEQIPKGYIDEVLNIVEEHSINQDVIDFEKLREKAYLRIQGANAIEDCYPAVRSILSNLEDNHSVFMPKEAVRVWKSTSETKSIEALISFFGKRIHDSIGYIKMDTFSSGDELAITTYADSLQQLIKSIDHESLKGWIIDLRENRGGNCWPMLTGIGPVLGDGVCGYFVNNKNEKASWFYRNGASGENEKVIAKISNRPYQVLNKNNPIAVLTGKRTASSGEVIVTAFHNKPNSKSFGGETAGLTTGNADYKLSDGSMIFVTTSIYADREGVVFGKKIQPNKTVAFSYTDIGSKHDPVIKEAVYWINKETTRN